MLSVASKAGPYIAPKTDSDSAFAEAQKTREPGKANVNFESVLSASNALVAEQLEKDKQALGEGGELRVGESKNDREFREMLERVSGKKQDALKNKLDKDDYLNLMVTQLKYQDPTKPLENHEMATQLAQFNTVEQLIGVNKTLQSMQNQSAQANIDKLTPYLGRVVEVNGSKIRVSPDQKVTQGAVELQAQAGSVSVMIKDSSGSVVRTIGLGEKSAGRHEITWDGQTDSGAAAKPGDYTFEVMASSQDGKQMQTKTSFSARVDAITDLANGGKLDTASGKVEAKDILAIRPDVTPSAAPAPAAAIPAAPNKSVGPKAPAAAAAPGAAVTAPGAAVAAPGAAVAAPGAALAAPGATAPAAAKTNPAKRERPKAEVKDSTPRNDAARADKAESNVKESKSAESKAVENKAVEAKATDTKQSVATNETKKAS